LRAASLLSFSYLSWRGKKRNCKLPDNIDNQNRKSYMVWHTHHYTLPKLQVCVCVCVCFVINTNGMLFKYSEMVDTNFYICIYAWITLGI